MPSRKMKVVLAFKDDVAATLTPVTRETDELIDKIIGEMAVKKWIAWCG